MNKILTRKHKLDQNISHFETKLKYIIKRKGLESAKEFINSPHTSLENHPNRYQLRQKYLNLISSLQKIQKIVKEKTSLSFTKLSTQYGFSKTFLINFQHEWGKYLPQIDVSKNMIQIT
jgi:DNA-directed RNA polymerase